MKKAFISISIVICLFIDPAFGESTEQSELEKIKSLAEQGLAEAQFVLGQIYHEGKGGVLDYREAIRWYLKAAEQGYALAQVYLGTMYYKGQGVPQDYKEAVKWYRKGAEQGDAEAQVHLGAMYILDPGQGVPQDYVQAHMWYSLSAAQGNEKAIKNRDIIASLMTPQQIAEAQRLAREWTEKHKQE